MIAGVAVNVSFAQEREMKIHHFLTVDPKADQYPGVNPYLYCAGNPIMYVDPTGEEKLNLVDCTTSPLICRSAEEYKQNTGVIHIWAHGIYSKQYKKYLGIECYGIDGDMPVTNAYVFYAYLMDVPLFIENTDNKCTIVVLHSCGAGEANGFAQDLSKQYNLLVVAPNDIVEVTYNPETGTTTESVKNGGCWIIYYKGEKVNSFKGETKPLFDHPEQVIERYEREYQERHKNDNDSLTEK